MAKSLRSKWKRKCRAVKRDRYGKKELERLKKTLGIDEKTQNTDVAMQEISEVANVTDIKKKQSEEQSPTNSASMETNERVFNPKTLRDQHGSYPIWLHPRKIVKKCKAKKNKSKKSHKISKNKAKN